MLLICHFAKVVSACPPSADIDFNLQCFFFFFNCGLRGCFISGKVTGGLLLMCMCNLGLFSLSVVTAVFVLTGSVASFVSCFSLSSFYFPLAISSLIRSWNELQSAVIISPHPEPITYFPSPGGLILSFPTVFNISLNKGAPQEGFFFKTFLKKRSKWAWYDLMFHFSTPLQLYLHGASALAATVWYTVFCSRRIAEYPKGTRQNAGSTRSWISQKGFNNNLSHWRHVRCFLITVSFFLCKTWSVNQDRSESTQPVFCDKDAASVFVFLFFDQPGVESPDYWSVFLPASFKISRLVSGWCLYTRPVWVCVGGRTSPVQEILSPVSNSPLHLYYTGWIK